MRSHLALILAGVVAVAGCSDDDAAPSTAPETTTAVETGFAAGDSAADEASPDLPDDVSDIDPDEQDLAFDDIPPLVDEVIGSVVAVQTTFGEGSGVVIDDGIAVTNAHVVGEDDQMTVVLATGEAIPAQVVGTDAFTDLAVLDLEGAEDVPPLALAEELPAIGSLAVAIGNPLGFENTVSVGVVSGLERSIPGGGAALVGLLQTDAAISPGNSGGALIGPGAEVIGINVAYLPPGTGAVSVGFAIPAPVVRDVTAQLLAGGPVEHPYLGVRVAPVTATIADQLGLEDTAGVLVAEAVPGGPAAVAGLEPGDVITSLGDRDVTSVGDFLGALRSFEPGETVDLTVVRGGETASVPVTLAGRT